ncbi:uncharacterized protein LOC122365524 [Amphibalanus amphitrite]|uniref:uncharacterized protein LOC122365524 n=1 Tax=Amphibalanus amphitrite TaxID=1232801 RepID=UPI001C92074A|nr:uncharacterized protein LOC122365524 [Amphibalanus amphitrite]
MRRQLTQEYAVAGQSAELPCDVTPPSRSDRLRLVLWYHGTGGTPIYTTRVTFRLGSKGAALVISQVKASDQQLYRCRVDFLQSPTRNSRVNLTVIASGLLRLKDNNTGITFLIDTGAEYSVLPATPTDRARGTNGLDLQAANNSSIQTYVPPEPPTIYEGQGRMPGEGIIGPYKEGDTTRLLCVASNGRPQPNVTWWRDNALVDATWATTEEGATENQLTLGPLRRADLGAVLTCWSANHPLATPRSATVTVTMILKPLTVSFLGANLPLSAGRRHQLTCETVGSRPAAIITWWMADSKLTEVTQRVTDDGNRTVSTVTLTPQVGHSGQSVKCRAVNTDLMAEVIEQSWRLTIYYVPVVTIQLQSPHGGAELIAEGDDVILGCHISADPPAHSIEWRLNERPLNRNSSGGLTEITNGTLVLRGVSVRDVGHYSCAARNSEGEGRSNQLYLPVRHVPDCKQFQKRSYETARGETVNVTCEVNSFPPPKTFFWALNSTGTYQELPQSRVRSRQGVSVASVSTQSQRDYGTLLCWAENTVGRQTEPCVFALRPADRPERPRSCQVTATSPRALTVSCQPGGDGGLRQSFHLEVLDTQDRTVVFNSTAETPRFKVPGLVPGRRYMLTLHASNERGRSDLYVTPAAVPVDTAAGRTAEITGRSDSLLEVRPVIGVLVGVVGALVLLAIAIVVAMRVRGITDAKDHRRAAAGVDYEIQLRQEQVSRLSDKYAAELARHMHSGGEHTVPVDVHGPSLERPATTGRPRPRPPPRAGSTTSQSSSTLPRQGRALAQGASAGRAADGPASHSSPSSPSPTVSTDTRRTEELVPLIVFRPPASGTSPRPYRGGARPVPSPSLQRDATTSLIVESSSSSTRREPSPQPQRTDVVLCPRPPPPGARADTDGHGDDVRIATEF